MARHVTPQRRIDEVSFPVRIKVRVPPDGLGVAINLALRWLDAELGSGNFANWPTVPAHGSATAFHFRSLEDAARLYAAFPMLELADAAERPCDWPRQSMQRL